jgi:hypothetical protein
MCGIAAFFSTGAPVSPEALRRATRAPLQAVEAERVLAEDPAL